MKAPLPFHAPVELGAFRKGLGFLRRYFHRVYLSAVAEYDVQENLAPFHAQEFFTVRFLREARTVSSREVSAHAPTRPTTLRGKLCLYAHNLGVGMRCFKKVVHRIVMGAGARHPAHGLLILAHEHGVGVVRFLGEANTVPRRRVSAYGSTQRVARRALFNTRSLRVPPV
jgi:hypothetical protein